MNPIKLKHAAAACLIACCTALTSTVSASSHPTSLNDPLGDASPRPTDPGGAGEFDPSAAPDLLSAAVIPWSSTDPANDPYTGAEANPNSAHLFRIDLVFDGGAILAELGNLWLEPTCLPNGTSMDCDLRPADSAIKG